MVCNNVRQSASSSNGKRFEHDQVNGIAQKFKTSKHDHAEKETGKKKNFTKINVKRKSQSQFKRIKVMLLHCTRNQITATFYADFFQKTPHHPHLLATASPLEGNDTNLRIDE